MNIKKPTYLPSAILSNSAMSSAQLNAWYSKVRRKNWSFALRSFGLLAALSQPAYGDQIIALTSTTGGGTGDTEHYR